DPQPAAPLPNNVPPPDGNPGQGAPGLIPQPVNPFPNGPVFADAEWVPVDQADGFEAKMPGKVFVFNTWQENIYDKANFLTIAKGMKYQVHDKEYNFDITFVDAPANARPDLKKIAAGPF